METFGWVMVTILFSLAGGTAGFFIKKSTLKREKEKMKKKIEEQHKKIKESIKLKTQNIIMDAKDKAFKIREEAKKEEIAGRQKNDNFHNLLTKKEEKIDNQISENEKSKQEYQKKKKKIEEIKEELKNEQEKQIKKLEEITNTSKEEAKEILLKKVEKNIEEELAKRIKNGEKRIKTNVKDVAKKIIVTAIQKYSSDVTMETTVKMVPLSDDDMKGRIIGREGRNINSFEKVTGVDVIIDDIPNSIIISSFDPMRRYMAKKTMQILIEDGRIHPARIEEVYKKVIEETEELMYKLGEKALYDVNVTGITSELTKVIGKLRFRTSYGQNVLKHSIECAYLAEMIASEVGADAKLVKKAAILHDIGKVISHEKSGSHAKVGAELAKKNGIDEKIVNCIEAHHEETEAKSVEAIIIQAADAISASRPGARRETLSSYLKRIEELETLCQEFDGVKKVYAIQAGREVRVIVSPEEIDDTSAIKLAKNMAKKVENDLNYPGEIKISVLRETRVEEFAR